jgi:hypothetical protein
MGRLIFHKLLGQIRAKTEMPMVPHPGIVRLVNQCEEANSLSAKGQVV